MDFSDIFLHLLFISFKNLISLDKVKIRANSTNFKLVLSDYLLF